MCVGNSGGGSNAAAEAAASEASRRADEALSEAKQAAATTRAALAGAQDNEPARKAQEAIMRRLSTGGAYARNFIRPNADPTDIGYSMLFGS